MHVSKPVSVNSFGNVTKEYFNLKIINSYYDVWISWGHTVWLCGAAMLQFIASLLMLEKAPFLFWRSQEEVVLRYNNRTNKYAYYL